MISDETGGFAVVNRNDFRDAFSRIIQDNSSYYVLGYYSTDTRRDGRFRQRPGPGQAPGLTVRARRATSRRRARRRPPTAARQATTSPALRDALDSPIPISGLALQRLRGAVQGHGAERLDRAGDRGRRPRAEVRPEGRPLHRRRRGQRVRRRQGRQDQGRRAGRRAARAQAADARGRVARPASAIARRLELPPGSDQLRVGVRDGGSGATGSVHLRPRRAGLLQGAALDERRAARVGVREPASRPRIPIRSSRTVLPAPPTASASSRATTRSRSSPRSTTTRPRSPHRVAIKTSVIADDGKVVLHGGRRAQERGAAGRKGRLRLHRRRSTRRASPRPLRPARRGETLLTNGGTAKRELEFRIR